MYLVPFYSIWSLHYKPHPPFTHIHIQNLMAQLLGTLQGLESCPRTVRQVDQRDRRNRRNRRSNGMDILFYLLSRHRTSPNCQDVTIMFVGPPFEIRYSIENSLLVSDSPHSSFCIVKLKHPTVGRGRKTHFGVEGFLC